MTFISPSTVLLHVVLGLPLFLFPSGVQCSAVLVIDCGSLRSTCPIHFHLRLEIMMPMPSCLHLRNRSSLEIFSGQKMRRILRRHMVWKDLSLVRSVSVILQHSDPYRSVDTTQLWYSFSLVLVLYCVDLQTLFISLNTLLALPSLLWMSSFVPPSGLMMLPSNVSKYNYCFSDFPFPEDVTDYPHHSEMAQYIVDYTQHFGLQHLIRFHTKVVSITQKGERWEVVVDRVEEDDHTECGERHTFLCRYVAIASGHHAKPSWAHFPGQESFTGEIIHSVDYKDPLTNGFVGKRVLVVGIGNSAVDAAVDCTTVGRCKSVYISTRSGAWIFPNYLSGFPTDLYACRAFLMLPWKFGNMILESVVKLVSGNPRRWGLNPKMRMLQTQPTVSPTLIHHIQRKNIIIAPNIVKIEGDTVHFVNGTSGQFDKIVLCTGYKIDLPYLCDELRAKAINEESNEISLYKNVFSPNIGPSLAFIGFVQPASGGVVPMSEMQARWFGQVCKGNVRLPPKHEMELDIQTEKAQHAERWYASARHTIQRDPIVYNDEIASFFGAKPEILKHPTLAWRLLLSSCGTAQWRLQGPGKWSGAAGQIQRVPLTPMMNIGGYLVVILIAILLYFFLSFISWLLSFVY